MKLEKIDLQEALIAFKPIKEFIFYNQGYILTGLDKTDPVNSGPYIKLKAILKDNFSGFAGLEFSKKYPNQFSIKIHTLESDENIIKSLVSIISEFDFEPYRE